ncbi:MAG: YaaR family protein [Clostridiaceae bacterium]|nr:YaaR family protein [Clostridiaceae bacterium]
MLKVGSFNYSLAGTAAANVNEQNYRTQELSSVFSLQFQQQSDDEQAAGLYALRQQIIDQGEQLTRQMDIGHLMNYRESLTDFFRQMIDYASELQLSDYGDRRGHHQLFVTIKNINQEMNAMAGELLSGQEDHINLLDRLDTIRGLIMDLII